MSERNTVVAVQFRIRNGNPKRAYAMDFCLCKEGGNRLPGSMFFSSVQGNQNSFPAVFEKWYSKTFENWNLPRGRMPVVIGWGIKDREIFDRLLENVDIALLTQAISYLDVKAYALSCNRIKGIKSSDGWRKIASKVKSLDPQYAAMDQPTPRAIVEMFFALENNSDAVIISTAFLDVVKVITADGIITTDEAKLLRSFISTLLDKQPRFNDLARELDEILEDNVVDDRESRRLIRILDEMESDFKGGRR